MNGRILTENLLIIADNYICNRTLVCIFIFVTIGRNILSQSIKRLLFYIIYPNQINFYQRKLLTIFSIGYQIDRVL